MKHTYLLKALLLASLIAGTSACSINFNIITTSSDTSTNTTTASSSTTSSTNSSSRTTSTNSSTSSTSSSSSSSSSTSSTSTSTDSSDYYSRAFNKTGSSLKSALRTIMSDGHNQLEYQQTRSMYKYSDADPDVSGNLILFYCRHSVNGTWDAGNTYDREHVWPQSLGGFGTSGAGADLHHLRPTSPTINSTRGNKPYAVVKGGNYSSIKATYNGTNYLGGYYTDKYFEPLDEVKGDVARIIMYLITRYSELETRFSNPSYSPFKDCSYETMLEWHELDPVDDLERARNEYVYTVQYNRNAFIDHPEYASLIWG